MVLMLERFHRDDVDILVKCLGSSVLEKAMNLNRFWQFEYEYR